MPIYEYKCSVCQDISEHIHKISENGPTECPKCGKSEMKKLISQSSFVLKGGGWYNDAYASKNAGKTKTSATDKPQSSATK